MKKRIAALLAAVLLLLAGCASSNSAAGAVTAPDDKTLPAGSTEPGSTPDPEAETPDLTQDPEPEAPSLPPETKQPEPDSVPKTEPAEPNSEDETDPAEPGFPVEPIDPWSLIESVSFEQGFYTDDLGNEVTYGYELVKVGTETPGAKAINEDIDRVFGGYIREAHKEMEEGLSLGIEHVGFNGHVWEDILTIEMIAHMDFEVTDIRPYCYDVYTCEWLGTADILRRMDVSQEEFLEACRQRFQAVYEERYQALPAEQRESSGYYEGLRRCSSDEFVNMELRIYPEDGDIVVIAPIVSLAGADYYYEKLWLFGGEE